MESVWKQNLKKNSSMGNKGKKNYFEMLLLGKIMPIVTDILATLKFFS